MKPDFTNKTYYPVQIIKDDKVICESFFNEKAWNKTIENGILWEYIPDNGRVLEHSLEESGSLDMNNAKIENDIVKVTLVDGNADNMTNIPNSEVLYALEKIIRQRKKDMPANSYTTHLFEKGEEKILKKMGEECIEVILAKTNKDVIYESADLIYHLMVYLAYKDISVDDLLNELKSR